MLACVLYPQQFCTRHINNGRDPAKTEVPFKQQFPSISHRAQQLHGTAFAQRTTTTTTTTAMARSISAYLTAALALASTAMASPIEEAAAGVATRTTIATAHPSGSATRAAPEAFVTSFFCLYQNRNCGGTAPVVYGFAYNQGGIKVTTAPGTFNSVKFCGGAHADDFAACAQGNSCFNTAVAQIQQDGTTCTSANQLGSGSFDKILIDS